MINKTKFPKPLDDALINPPRVSAYFCAPLTHDSLPLSALAKKCIQRVCKTPVPAAAGVMKLYITIFMLLAAGRRRQTRHENTRARRSHF